MVAGTCTVEDPMCSLPTALALLAATNRRCRKAEDPEAGEWFKYCS